MSIATEGFGSLFQTAASRHISSGFVVLTAEVDPSGGPALQSIPLCRVAAGDVIKSCTLYGLGLGIDASPLFLSSGYQFVLIGDDDSWTALTSVLTPHSLITEITLDPAVTASADATVILVVTGAATGDKVKGDVSFIVV